jgi:hypothetical protein
VFKSRQDFAVKEFFLACSSYNETSPSKKIFSYERLHAASSKNSVRQATYEEPRFPTFRDTSAALKLQATYFDKPFVTTRPM